MENKITRNAAELLAAASPAVRAIIERLNEYVERKHTEQPSIPRESWWAALEAELIDMVEDRAEG